jgi:biopolymer transport protein TolR
MDFKTDRHRDRSPLSQINVTPLVDVMLVLLIIFMVTASMGQQGITVNLPRAQAQPLNVSSDLVTVSIDKDRKVYINATPVALADLGPQLKALYQNRTDKSVYLKSDAEVPYGDFVKVVAVVKASGVEKLGMLTDIPKD